MPIRAENRSRYPANWRQISQRIRFERAGGQCECLGECGKHDGRCAARHGEPHPETGWAKVVLTAAHRDHIPENCDETNLFAACERCHNAYDAEERRETAARTRAARLGPVQEVLFPVATLKAG